MNVSETDLPGVLLIEPKVFGDNRGFFFESYERDRYREADIPLDFVQDNVSRSRKGVLRGLHFQLQHPQGKLVFVISGAVFDVAVDIRVGSPTFGQWTGAELNDENHRQLYIPPGFGHGFCVLSDSVDFMYKCTDFYHPEDEGGVQWNDPDIGITWPVSDPILSERDKTYQPLKDIDPAALPRYEAPS